MVDLNYVIRPDSEAIGSWVESENSIGVIAISGQKLKVHICKAMIVVVEFHILTIDRRIGCNSDAETECCRSRSL